MLDYLGHLYYVKLHLYVIRDLRAAAHNNLQTFQKGQSAALNPNAIQPDCLEHPPWVVTLVQTTTEQPNCGS